MFEIEIIDQYDKLSVLKSEWNLLLKSSETNTVFLTHEWITTWWEHFKKDKKLFVLIVRKNKCIKGIAPFMISFSKIFAIKKNKIQFIGAPLSDYSDFIIGEDKEDVLKMIYNYLFENKDRWNSVSLEEIPENSSTLSLSKNILKDMTKNFDMFFTNTCLSYDFNKESYERLKKNLKKRDIRRKINGLKNNGNLSFHCINDLKNDNSLLDIFFNQHIKLWDSKGSPSMFKQDKYKKFFIEIATNLSLKKEIGICTLKFNEKPISFQFGFEYNNKYLAYCSSYDLEYYKKSPSSLLNNFLLKHYFELNCNEVDFSRGAEEYKFRFTNKKTDNLGLCIHKNFFSNIISKFYNKTKEKIIRRRKVHAIINKYKNNLINIISRSDYKNIKSSN